MELPFITETLTRLGFLVAYRILDCGDMGFCPHFHRNTGDQPGSGIIAAVPSKVRPNKKAAANRVLWLHVPDIGSIGKGFLSGALVISPFFAEVR